MEYVRPNTTTLLANATAILGTLVLILIPTVYLYWRSSIKRAIKSKLQVTVHRDPAAAKAADWYKRDALLSFLELDSDVVAADFGSKVPMISLGEYMASLVPKGTFSLQGALVTIMEKKGLRIALPLALFAPPKWRKESNLVGAFGKSPYASLFLSNMLSTLGLITVSALTQRQNMDAKRQQKVIEEERKKKKPKHNALFPGSPKKKSENKKDPSAAVVGETDQKKKKEGERQHPKGMTPIEIMVRGSKPDPDRPDSFVSRMPPKFTLPTDLEREMKLDVLDVDLNLNTLNPTPSSTFTSTTRSGGPNSLQGPTPAPINPLFPDLCIGNGGMPLTCSVAQTKVNDVVAALLNRLAANSIVGLGQHPVLPTQPFVVELPIQGKNEGGDGMEAVQVTSVEEFVDVLERSGHTVKMALYSNITSFGLGLSIDERDGAWTQVPLAYPLSTGLYAQDEQGNQIDVVTLMTHAGVSLEISGPTVTAGVEWCLSIRGVTGWVPNAGVDRPWAAGQKVKTQHAGSALDTPEGRRRALRLTTASASVLNVSASMDDLMFGGYGALGVCIDSVAAVQQVLTGKCTLYPLVMGGDAKLAVLHRYRFVQARGRERTSQGKWEYEEEANALHTAIATLPCDGIVHPDGAAATARRAMACLPERSVFAGVKKCRELLQRAADVADYAMAPSASS